MPIRWQLLPARHIPLNQRLENFHRTCHLPMLAKASGANNVHQLPAARPADDGAHIHSRPNVEHLNRAQAAGSAKVATAPVFTANAMGSH